MDSIPIIYLDREDLKAFLSNENANEEGVSYEWEDERVIHIKMKPYNHSFGKTGRVFFSLGGSNAENDANRPLWESGKYSFVVYVNNFKPRVFEIVNGEYIGKNIIEACWCEIVNGERFSWSYKTDIPHSTFVIWEDYEPYCLGIVFSVDDLK